jgi:hypothetical protein
MQVPQPFLASGTATTCDLGTIVMGQLREGRGGVQVRENASGPAGVNVRWPL